MKLISIAFLFMYTSIAKSNILRELSKNLASLLSKSNDTEYKIKLVEKPSATRYFGPQNQVDDDNDLIADAIELKVRSQKRQARRYQDNLSDGHDTSSPKLVVPLGISNEDIERRAVKETGFRRFSRDDLNRNWIYSRSIGLTSTSADEKAWKTEYKYRWNSRKKDALIDPIANQSRGHIVNMAAARPWRVPCGDPMQHDMPSGSCTLAIECPPEYRIYRGDYLCGRTTFICCGLQIYDKDMYEAFDSAMVETSQFSTSSDEILKDARGSRENKKRKRQRKRNRTLKARYRRKRFIKKTIRKLAKEVRKELNRAFRNSTENRRHVIRNLKILIKKMKHKFRDERHIAKFQQDLDLANINLNLQEKLKKIRGLNYNFLTNDTFRTIIVNGTATRQGIKNTLLGAKPLFEAYPELNSDYIEVPEALTKTRRTGGDIMLKKKDKKRHKRGKDYLEYDIELGLLG